MFGLDTAVAVLVGLLSLTVVCGCTGISTADLLEAAKNGDVRAQYLLGGRYAKGEGVAKDMAEAAKWYRKAAEQGFEPAQKALKQIGK